MAAKVKRLILLPSPKLRPRGKEVLCCFTSAITYIIAILSALSLQLHAAPGAIKSDAEVQGVPCDGVVHARQALHSWRNFKHCRVCVHHF